MNPSDRTNPVQEPPAGDLYALKELLLRDELEAIADLREEVDNSKLGATELAALLPKAVRRADPDGLGKALRPTITEAFQEAVRKNPQSLVDAISPIMAPAISTAIRNAIRGMMQSLNQIIEQSFTVRGLKWRWQSFRTGRPLGEVVLLNTMEYRVEHVFLVRREDGILLAEVAKDDAADSDADLVSGMLTAIRDLARDSLGADKDETLLTVDLSGRTVWLEQGQHATLVAVILGCPPKSYRGIMREANGKIHAEFAEPLRAFDGDASELEDTEQRMEEWKRTFSEADEHLERCLLDDPKAEAGGSKWKHAWVIPVVALSLLAAWGGSIWYRHHSISRVLQAPESVDWSYKDRALKLSGSAHHDWIEQATAAASALGSVDSIERDELVDLDAEWLKALAQLNSAPGIVVVKAMRAGEQYQLEGLRDPLAINPDDVIAAAGLSREKVQASWTAFRSLDREIVMARVQDRLPANEQAAWTWNDSGLVVEGSASKEWLQRATAIAAEMGSEVRIDLSAVKEIDDPEQRRKHQAWLAAVVQLSETPGIHVTRADETGHGYQIEGLRDPLAPDPQKILGAHGFDGAHVQTRWTPFDSREPDLIAKRFQRNLPECETVDWQWSDGRLVATGRAPHRWLDVANSYGNLMRSDILVDLSGVEDIDASRRDQLTDQIRAIELEHKRGNPGLKEGQVRKLEQLRDAIRALRVTCDRMGDLPQVVILGYADADTPTNQVMSMSIARARGVWQVLGQLGLSDENVIVKGMGNPPLGKNREGNSQLQVKFLGLPVP